MSLGSSKAVILIVEDEPFLRMAAVDFIGEAGFETIDAANADEAIAILESRNDIRLIFTDIDMPSGSMNGLKLARAVRGRWPPIQIILVSGHRFPGDSDMPAGGRVFSKPYAAELMITTMHEMLGRA